MTKPKHEAALRKNTGGKRLTKKRLLMTTNLDEDKMNKTNFLKIHSQLMIAQHQFQLQSWKY